MATLECILCPIIIQKKGDVNLVHGKRDFEAGLEIGNLSFVVRPFSQHICRSCLNLIKQRGNLKKKLEDLNTKLLVGYQEKARAKGFAVKMKESAKRSLRFYEDLSCDTSEPSHLTPKDNLTQNCAKTPKSISSSIVSISPIAVVPGQPSASSTPVAKPLCISQIQLRPSPPRDSKGHSQARLSPHPDICNVVVTRGRGICQQRDITPGHLSLTEKTAATCFRDCVVKMDDFLGQDEAFVASWLENEGLAKLVAIFKGRN